MKKSNLLFSIFALGLEIAGVPQGFCAASRPVEEVGEQRVGRVIDVKELLHKEGIFKKMGDSLPLFYLSFFHKDHSILPKQIHDNRVKLVGSEQNLSDIKYAYIALVRKFAAEMNSLGDSFFDDIMCPDTMAVAFGILASRLDPTITYTLPVDLLELLKLAAWVARANESDKQTEQMRNFHKESTDIFSKHLTRSKKTASLSVGLLTLVLDHKLLIKLLSLSADKRKEALVAVATGKLSEFAGLLDTSESELKESTNRLFGTFKVPYNPTPHCILKLWFKVAYMR